MMWKDGCVSFREHLHHTIPHKSYAVWPAQKVAFGLCHGPQSARCRRCTSQIGGSEGKSLCSYTSKLKVDSISNLNSFHALQLFVLCVLLLMWNTRLDLDKAHGRSELGCRMSNLCKSNAWLVLHAGLSIRRALCWHWCNDHSCFRRVWLQRRLGQRLPSCYGCIDTSGICDPYRYINPWGPRVLGHQIWI